VKEKIAGFYKLKASKARGMWANSKNLKDCKTLKIYAKKIILNQTISQPMILPQYKFINSVSMANCKFNLFLKKSNPQIFPL